MCFEMFDLGKILKEAKVSQEYMAMKIGVTNEYLNEAISSGDEDLQAELYEQFLGVVSGEQLVPDLLEFYGEFSEDHLQLEEFLREAVFFQDSNVPRRMVITVERLVALADDMEQVRKGRDGLKIFFLVVCIEALNELAYPKNSNTKVGMVIDFFKNQVCLEHKELILKMVKRSLADQRFNVSKEDFETVEEYENRRAEKIDWNFNTDISIEVFAKIINEVRNIFAHEGSYWEFHFSDGKIPLINGLFLAETQEEYNLVRNGKQKLEERIYDINLTYPDFRRICVNGFMNFMSKYLVLAKSKTD